MSNILLTSGRGNLVLALARRLHAAGHRVFVADNWPHYLSKYSTAVERAFQTPPAAQETKDWIKAIARIVTDCRIDLIVPVFEEIVYLARAAEELPAQARIFAADFDTLATLHSKWLFNQKAKELGLPVPESELITGRDDLLAAYEMRGATLVFKPAYSRFSAFTVVCPASEQQLEGAEPSSEQPWVAQQFLPGRIIATTSLALNGRIAAHATYPLEYSIGSTGPTTVYRSIDQPRALEWVRELVACLNFTGQIGIDFIERDDGGVSAIECNPRLTGGGFLLKDDPRFAEALVDPDFPGFVRPSTRPYVSRFSMLFCLLDRSEHFPGLREWSRVFGLGRSTVAFKWSDPLPSLLEPLVSLEFIFRALKNRLPLESYATVDHEWNHVPDCDSTPKIAHPRPDFEISAARQRSMGGAPQG